MDSAVEAEKRDEKEFFLSNVIDGRYILGRVNSNFDDNKQQTHVIVVHDYLIKLDNGTPTRVSVTITKKSGEIVFSGVSVPLVRIGFGALILSVSYDGRYVDMHINGRLAMSNNPELSPYACIVFGMPRSGESQEKSWYSENHAAHRTRKIAARDAIRAAKEISKTTDELIQELSDELENIADNITHFHLGQRRRLISIGQSVRSLIVRESTGKPLIQNISGRIDMPVFVYGRFGAGDIRDLPAGIPTPLVHLMGGVSEAPRPGFDTLLDLDVWLNLKGANFNGVKKSNNDILREFCNKSAAHFDNTFSNDILTLQARGFARDENSKTVLENWLVGVASVALSLGKRLVAK